MKDYSYIYNFKKYGFGMFVHFGLYSIVGKGEWYQNIYNVDYSKYSKLMNRFKVKKNWAKELVRTAKKSGVKYITITTRHHDGFSLYDTCGLNEFDAPHSACHRDLIKEFVEECNKENIVPFFYHTLLDWYNKDYDNDFKKYLVYLRKSIEILCTRYGSIGGFWFDGMWSKPNEDWEEDELYSLIRKYQKDAMIINNTGLSELGKTGHIEIDSVTFERGKPTFVDQTIKPIAGEMCQILNDHWGVALNDVNYKKIGNLLEDLIDSRFYSCNFLLNVGLQKDGSIKTIESGMFYEIGKWIKMNKNFIYDIKPYKKLVDGSMLFYDDKWFYIAIPNVGMSADKNVQLSSEVKHIEIDSNLNIKNARWLDNNKKVKHKNNIIFVEPFSYGNSGFIRVLRFEK